MFVGLFLAASAWALPVVDGGRSYEGVATGPVAEVVPAPGADGGGQPTSTVTLPSTPAAPRPESVGAGVVVDRVAAVVNDEIITLSEIYEFGESYIEDAVARPSSGSPDGEGGRDAAEREVLERLIERRLVSQEMTALKLDIRDEDVDRSIDDIARRNGLDREALRTEVERSGMAWDAYRSELKENLRDMKFAQAVLRPRVTVTEDELRDAWRRSAGGAPASSQVQALFLAFPKDADEAARAAVVAKAEGLRGQIVGGADFAEISRKNDEGPFGAQDGEMGTFAPGELVPELDAVVTATGVGEVSKPIVLGQGVFLLKVVERKLGTADFETMRPKLEDEVFMVRMEDEKQRWFLQARRRAAVRILLPSPAGRAAAPVELPASPGENPPAAPAEPLPPGVPAGSSPIPPTP